MKTKEELLTESGIDWELFELENEFSAKAILTAMERYAKQNLGIPAIMQAEPCVLLNTDFNGKCFKCGLQVFQRESEATVGNGAAGIGVCVCADLGNTEVNKINDKWICTKCNKPLASSAGSL